ncbi:hypothetical protein K435DRAFT_777691 [Dendrothele bispora CBS 962.96]|uniref:Fucose-specific lectin n=1 Tax=Dendrothele bispora (strain CBS 962.96) TaxID=1314807 RepID=A0A4S8M6T6_DENBC|nr:hypothetical protein K435DRAFT_777691 [Dendrothele bispora CBS 962.96]
MLFNKYILTILPFFLTTLIGSKAQDATLSPHVEPVDAVGDIAAVQVSNGGTRIYYEPRNGSGIAQICTSAPFSTGDTNCHTGNFGGVAAGDVLPGTPVAAVTLDGFSELRVYFFSRDNVLSEAIWTTAGGARSGDACPNCITHSGFQVVPGSKALYAMISTTMPASHVRVGFISAASPNTITEAILNSNTNRWSLSTLPTMT